MTTFRHRVRYHEVDQQGYLFNARYFEIADVAMTEYFRDLGWRYDELNALGVDPSVVHVSAEFTGPARFDDQLDVKTFCHRVGTSSFQLTTQIELGEAPVASLNIVYVNVDASLARSLPLPEPVSSALRNSMEPQQVVRE
ncbi:thioesterase family protein [Arthrobacter sp. ISL-5]|uniref:acyl-CoA thioesterase n=1 Tax=Arthrobacter sp. ISL-5 TaxID=2819111 RepID=UPI001BEABA96|nr:thioesterase family protein [Arthrobacter sp. ISL-5]MBT2554159.1 acyl-CoA thioesterase [Arthrobacter sp. ISL-5]